MDITAVSYDTLNPTQGYGQPFAVAGSAQTNGPSLAPDPQRTHDKAVAFTDHLVLRLEQEAGDESKDTSALANSLIGAIDTIGAEFGDAAATAAIGLIARNVGEGEITEDTLGEGLLDVLRFVDRNFGVEAGDRMIAAFNGDLNSAINDYFDNGLLEQFYAADGTQAGGGLPLATQQMVAEVQGALGQEAADTVSQILDQGLAEGANFTNLRKSLARAKNALARDHEPGAAAVLAHAAKDALAGLRPDKPAEPGAMLDVAV